MIRRWPHAYFLSWNRFQNISCRLIGYQLRSNIKDCYSILNVTDDSSDDEVKEAYLRLAKVYHPDSGTSSADPRKFNQIKEAYVAIKSHRTDRNTPADTDHQMEDDLDFDIKHTVPQHRQYLSYDGVGFGTPLQRQKQYAQHRVRKVSEDLFEHKKARWMKPSETALVNKTKSIARRNKMSKTIDRVVEDLIQESMQRGDFDNLAGYGKPIQYKDRNPLVDATTYKINQMLKDEGFAPDWIMLEKDIRDGILDSRHNLAKVLERIGTPPFPSSHLDKVWKYECEKFKANISLINDSVKKFNLIVPVMKKQLIPYSWDKERDRVMKNHREYLTGAHSKSVSSESYSISVERDKINSFDGSFRSQDPMSNSYDNVILWGEVWKQIKSMFSWKKSKTS
ncbi:dnaJ homolog subfamily C member 28-like [Saccostrea echinata]|uniref:dnaJ homolog subfamily C member 28-like n=1 Tax=Saccostrea echinata TaxID=191078 RepID=UPI002A80FD11|nr:dnaJ homolog subfamily C member 28-like [Saccostrea echinata]XP_061180350.1 dnaJ homolog subfamily C member 28-like [Saccostrea echinata]